MTESITSDQLIGTWKLQSFDISEDAGPTKPWGRKAHGLLIYTANGHMSVSINREKEPDSDSLSALLFYSGTYEVNNGDVKHFVTNASDINRIGSTLLRSATLESDTLILISRGSDFVATLTWKRIK